jgi:hypothetical protein
METPGLSSQVTVTDMRNHFVYLYLIMASTLALNACGSQESRSPEELLYDTNYDSFTNENNGWPWRGLAHDKPKRWETPIPIKTNELDRVHTALDHIEYELGQRIFDRSSIANIPEDQIKRGLIVSPGTAVKYNYVVDKDTCGNVAKGPGEFDWPNPAIRDDGTIDARLYINLGSDKCDDRTRGSAEWQIAAHEIAHAIGLAGGHFYGFQDNIPVSDRLWDTLRLLYPAPKSD